MSQPILSCHNLRKSYGALVAVDDLSLEVSAGEVLGIGGPNGAGKTSFFDIISGITRQDSGRVIFLDEDISHARPDQLYRAGLARTFQRDVAFDSMSAEDNLVTAIHFGSSSSRSVTFDANARKRARGLLDLLGISDLAAEETRNLPVYARRLLMIGAALGSRPRLLLLDEPVGGLSPQEVETVITILRRVKEETDLTIVLIEHVMRFLLSISDRVVIMHQGARLFEGTPGEMIRDHSVIDVYLGEGAASRLSTDLAKAAG